MMKDFTSPAHALKHLNFILSFNIYATHMPQLKRLDFKQKLQRSIKKTKKCR